MNSPPAEALPTSSTPNAWRGLSGLKSKVKLDLVMALDQLSWKERIAYLAHCLTPIATPAVPVEHTFTESGTYVRVMNIPAETVFIGREHVLGHEVVLTQGSVLWITPTGRFQVDAPYAYHSKPGDQMVIYTLTDIECHTTHPNPSGTTDTDRLEAMYFYPADQALDLGRRIAGFLE